MESLSDDDLYKKYRAGSRVAFDTLYSRYKQPLYNYVRKSINSDKVEELYQDIWLKVVSSAKHYKDSGRFRQWLFTCAHHLIVDEYRRNSRADYVPLPELSSQDIIGDERIASDIANALLELPMDQRQAFHLRHELGCSVAEIASIQECPVESAKSRLRYAYSKLKKHLKDYQP